MNRVPWRVKAPFILPIDCVRLVSKESSCLGLQLKFGGKFHLKLNIGRIPIANKYREGKMKRTLKRGLKVPEIAEAEPIEVSVKKVYLYISFELVFFCGLI